MGRAGKASSVPCRRPQCLAYHFQELPPRARPGGPGKHQPAEPAKQTTAGCRDENRQRAPGPEGRVSTSRRSRPSKQRQDAVCLREAAGRVRTSRRSRPSKQRQDAEIFLVTSRPGFGAAKVSSLWPSRTRSKRSSSIRRPLRLPRRGFLPDVGQASACHRQALPPCARPGGPGKHQPAEPAKQTTAGCRVFA